MPDAVAATVPVLVGVFPPDEDPFALVKDDPTMTLRMPGGERASVIFEPVNHLLLLRIQKGRGRGARTAYVRLGALLASIREVIGDLAPGEPPPPPRSAVFKPAGA